MSASTLTAFIPIAEGSESTPGLFNSRFQTLQDNIVSVNSVIPGTSVLSGSTWASIGLFANSNNSDYIRFVDSSGQRSTYRLGSHAGGTADGLNLWDESGSTMIFSMSKQSVRFFQTVVGPVFDVGGALTSTLNAGTFGTASDSSETRIQAAMTQAAQQGIERVYVPANMYPYSASSVSFYQTVHMVREGGDWVNYDVQAYGASPTTQFDSTAAFGGAISAASGKGLITVPLGNYSVTSLSFDGPTAISIKGASRDGTVIWQASGTTAPLLSFAQMQAIEGVDVQDMTLRGTAASLGGIKLGTNSANSYTAFVKIENIIVRDFTATNAYGIYLGAVQELAVDNCKIFSNYNNYFRPNSGFCTSTVIRGQKGYIGNATHRGVSLEGTVTDISFSEQVFESNVLEALYAAGFASNIIVSDCYFEANLSGGTAGTGTITVTGAAGAGNSAQLRLRRSHFHIVDPTNPTGKQLRLDYVLDSVIAENSGLVNSGGISTTANTQCHFEDNADAPSSADYVALYQALTGYGTRVTFCETATSDRRTEGGNRGWDGVHLKSTQATAPTCVVNANAGTSATASLDANATDFKGIIDLQHGSGAWAGGTQLTVTFNRPYAVAPIVIATPANDPAAVAYGTFHCSFQATTTGFTVEFGVASASAAHRVWNYLVIE